MDVIDRVLTKRSVVIIIADMLANCQDTQTSYQIC